MQTFPFQILTGPPSPAMSGPTRLDLVPSPTSTHLGYRVATVSDPEVGRSLGGGGGGGGGIIARLDPAPRPTQQTRRLLYRRYPPLINRMQSQ